MKRIAFLLYVVGMITTGSARAQDVKYDPNKYEVVSDVTSKSQSESNIGDAGSVRKSSGNSSVKKKPPKAKPSTGTSKTSSGSSYRTQKSVRSSEKVRTIVLREKTPPSPAREKDSFVYNDHRQYHYTINHNYSSSNDGALEVVSGVVWDTGVGIAQLKDAIDTCGRLKKRWTKAKWQKPMTKFKVYTREVYDEELQISYKTDTAWIWPAFKTRTYFVYEKHLKNKCMDTIVRFDTVKRWWVPVRRYGGIALLAGGGVLLADYACKNQYWGLFASNNNSGGNNNNNNNGNNGNTGNDPTNYPTHKPGSTTGNKPSGERQDVLPVKEPVSLAKKQLPSQYATEVKIKKYEPNLYLTVNFSVPLFTRAKSKVKFNGFKLLYL